MANYCNENEETSYQAPCEEEEEVCCDEEVQQPRTKKRTNKRHRKRRPVKEDEEEEEEMEEERPQRRKERSRPPHSHKSFDENSNTMGDAPQRPPQPLVMPPQPLGKPPQLLPPPPPKIPAVPVVEEEENVRACDAVAILILLAILLAIVVLALAGVYYQADSEWNEIMRADQPFPELEGESLFSNHYIFLYTKVPKLRHAHLHIMRENRLLEITHMTFYSTFLFCTIFQFIAYLIRGKNDHAKVVVIYYVVFIVCLTFIASFPEISWMQLERNYREASLKLQEYEDAQFKGRGVSLTDGASNFTAFDAKILHQILEFCRQQDDYGLLISDNRGLDFYMRHYDLHDFQELGFCASHKMRMINTIMGYLCMIVCCVIPCAACMVTTKTKRVSDVPIVVVQGQQQPVPGLLQPPGLPPPPGFPPQPPQQPMRPAQRLNDDDGNPLTDEQMAVIEKFRGYVLADN